MPTAIVHADATLTPTKAELLEAWLPGQDWFPGGEIRQLGSYRFVDADGEVGIETFLLDCGGVTCHVPLTYRGSELDGGRLAGTMEHSELGTRYVYDGTSDPVWALELLRTVAEAGEQASLSSGKEPTAHVRGSGVELGGISDVVVDGDGGFRAQTDEGAVQVIVPRIAGDLETARTLGHLTASWDAEGTRKEAVVAVVSEAMEG